MASGKYVNISLTMTPKFKCFVSLLVRLGKKGNKQMKKLFGWIWSNKKQETETYVVPQWESYTAKARRYNLDHGLPEDRLVG